ncbi:uncharacterized protein BDR25DRAFT_266783 [Lindgomyces ingoldianus]|uniref:Uncharacterized protein n=1 Tax=Lindgomyces ingoldianus TaxID=673940 RepID=A0ACB6QKE0_9PLEO|nr:uncharacterized protein BDR25DRAFT_266783 [Lindgomyces ingoldianus]KAF2467386.1 hypothetical protein BDR25DRAFT_266783 [Lindgomyces ingoldianus]
MGDGDKEGAQPQHSLIGALVEPDPSDDTGLNSHFGSTFAPRRNPPSPPAFAGLRQSPSVGIRPQNTGSTIETNPFRRSRASSVSRTPTLVNHGESPPWRRYEYPSPPNSASPHKEHFSHRSEAFGSLNEGGRPRRSSQPNQPSSSPSPSKGGVLVRGGSLRERYPGDNSHRPLDVIRKDTKAANRAYHLRKKNFQGADTIDRLDRSGLSYHHEGPYDAANFSRNTNWKHSPVAAVRDSNEEALRATPRENIIDAVTRHRPLEGVAVVPPGVPDKFGRVLDYEEGADLMREPGADYKRWPGVEYLPGDLKGKGEPSYSIEKALKDHKQYGDTGIELSTRRRNQSLGAADASSVPIEALDDGAGVGRSNTTGKSIGGSLKKRFGSLRRRRAET